MSYILDALRRAESERERDRGQMPGLHSPSAAGPDAAVAAVPGARLLVFGGALLALVLAVLAAWLLLRPREAVTPLPAPVPGAEQPAPVPQPVPVTQPGLVRLDPQAAAPPAPQPSVAVTQPVQSRAAGAAAPPQRLPRLNELPEDLRRQLPALTLGGAIMSDAPENRMLIVNGRVLHEGDLVSPELVLEQIRLKAAVLKYRDQRFEVAY